MKELSFAHCAITGKLFFFMQMAKILNDRQTRLLFHTVCVLHNKLHHVYKLFYHPKYIINQPCPYHI